MEREFTTKDREAANKLLYIVFVIAALPTVVFLILGCSLGPALFFDLIVMAPLWVVFLAWLSHHRWEAAHGVHIPDRAHYYPVERPIRVKPLIEGQIR